MKCLFFLNTYCKADDVDVWTSRSISEGSLDFEIMRVDCIFFTSFCMHFIFFQMAFREAHCISGKCVALAEKKGVKLSHLSLKHLRTTRYVIKILHFFFLFLAVQNHV